jgi:hypothetical protein
MMTMLRVRRTSAARQIHVADSVTDCGRHRGNDSNSDAAGATDTTIDSLRLSMNRRCLSHQMTRLPHQGVSRMRA